MPDDIFLEDALNQLAVYWPPGIEGDEGQQIMGDPIEIVCRWEMVVEQFLDRKSGNVESSKSKVYVDRDLEELGILWLPPNNTELATGQALSQLTSEEEPFTNPGAYEIRRFDKIPNFDADEFARIAYL